ncbi:hypothetical protein DPK31_17900 [Salmonella enterica subsp. enterica serovar Umbilo]|nr:hypothetical protein [Salmonella enterica subsp. enterica serovar Umbilo]
MCFARSGSPGINTTSAKSPISALICGVAIFSSLSICCYCLMAATPYQAYKTCVKTVKYPKYFAL